MGYFGLVALLLCTHHHHHHHQTQKTNMNLCKSIIYLPDDFMSVDKIVLQNDYPPLATALSKYCLVPLEIDELSLSADDYYTIVHSIYVTLMGGRLQYECIHFF